MSLQHNMYLQHNEISGEISRPALFARLAEGHASRVCVLTPNRRLAQALHSDFGAERARGGLATWETPDILPFAGFVARCWDDALHSDLAAGLPTLMSGAQEQAAWEEAIAGSRIAAGLLTASGTARQCREAWGIVHAWRLWERLPAHEGGEDVHAFLDWARRYERHARDRDLTDAARVPDAVAALLGEGATLALPATIVPYGFDVLTPQQGALLAACARAGIAIVRSGPEPHAAPRVARVALASPDEEHAAAARWARARLEAHPGARIAIVVPDLARARANVVRALQSVLQPARALLPSDEPAAFDVSLGAPLDAQPLVRDALALLRLCGRPVAFEEASRVVRSPYLEGAATERDGRARLDAVSRGRMGTTVTLDALARAARSGTSPAAPGLAEMLEALAAHRKAALFARRPAGEWARAFGEVMALAGFGGGGLDSVEYQAQKKWHDAIAELASLECVTGLVSYADALGRLARIVRETVFQPESPEVPIHVLGILESAGLEFDHLWITGLSEDAWPLPPRPNPFVPLRLQREAGIPGADAASSLALDRRITDSWLACAAEVVVSHPRVRDESECAPSPLVAALPPVSLEALGLPDYPTLRAAIRAGGRLERLADGRAPGVAAGPQPGGTALFRDQAACPFRAFARHRLASRPLENPQPGLGARERGTLVHEMMRAVWTALRDKAGLDACTGDALEALLGRSADEAIAIARPRCREALSGRFARVERERLVALARAWLEVERTRGDFAVTLLEERLPLTFAGLTVDGKVDRADRLASGGHAVLDYKSGAATVASWLGPRPEEPQLPMYALAAVPDVRAIAFARMTAGEREFCGIAMEEGLLPGVRTIEKQRSRQAARYASWTALVDAWRGEVEALAAAFREGDARVDPRRGAATCERCDQQPLCRIAEKGEP